MPCLLPSALCASCLLQLASRALQPIFNFGAEEHAQAERHKRQQENGKGIVPAESSGNVQDKQTDAQREKQVLATMQVKGGDRLRIQSKLRLRQRRAHIDAGAQPRQRQVQPNKDAQLNQWIGLCVLSGPPTVIVATGQDDCRQQRRAPQRPGPRHGQDRRQRGHEHPSAQDF